MSPFSQSLYLCLLSVSLSTSVYFHSVSLPLSPFSQSLCLCLLSVSLSISVSFQSVSLPLSPFSQSLYLCLLSVSLSASVYFQSISLPLSPFSQSLYICLLSVSLSDSVSFQSVSLPLSTNCLILNMLSNGLFLILTTSPPPMLVCSFLSCFSFFTCLLLCLRSPTRFISVQASGCIIYRYWSATTLYT
jgi:hypothetical protein